MKNRFVCVPGGTLCAKEIYICARDGRPVTNYLSEDTGLNPQVDYRSSAIGIMNMTPPESAVTASDIAVKSGNVYLGFADRFTGTLIITGEISDVSISIDRNCRLFSRFSWICSLPHMYKEIGSAAMARMTKRGTVRKTVP